MLDGLTLQTLTASTVALLSSLLGKAMEKGAEEVGKSAVGTIIEKLKDRLKHDGAKDALNDLVQDPSGGDVQAALRVQLKKAIESDTELAVFLKRMASETAPTLGGNKSRQNVNLIGDNNAAIAISGKDNSVTVR